LHGGQPANFLDVGGYGHIPFSISGSIHTLCRGATPETVKKAFEILLADPKVKSIFINIFGGIMRCDYIAEGVIKATKELSLTVPLVVRLKGTKEAEAKE
jgi:succinyl-CoA synthetase beta subunit